jgi:uroporphyrinogen-III synthase
VEEFPTGTGRVVVVQGERADGTLSDGLTMKGWCVTRCDVYRTIDTEPASNDLARAVSADAVVFASGSAAENWMRLVGPAFDGAVVVIGPVTKSAAEAVGLRVDATAEEASVAGIVTVLASTLSP